jgi:hypothetical protein
MEKLKRRYNLRLIGHLAESLLKWLRPSVYLSVYKEGTTREPLNEFTSNLVLEVLIRILCSSYAQNGTKVMARYAKIHVNFCANPAHASPNVCGNEIFFEQHF